MFESRRKQAIRLLKSQKLKIDKIETSINFGKWKVYADAIVKQYIGNTDFHRQQFTDIDLSKAPSTRESESRKATWLKIQKELAREYIGSCIEYLENNGAMTYEPNWFCKRSVSEILSMIAIFQSILFATILPFTCNQGKLQGTIDSSNKIRNLQSERDSLRAVLLDCLNNLPKPDNDPENQKKEKPVPNG